MSVSYAVTLVEVKDGRPVSYQTPVLSSDAEHAADVVRLSRLIVKGLSGNRRWSVACFEVYDAMRPPLKSARRWFAFQNETAVETSEPPWAASMNHVWSEIRKVADAT